MKNTKKAVTLVEAVVTMTILALWLIGVYKVYTNSIRFLDGVAAKTQAIQIAREWIEAVENIRDTNWILFPSNTENCWNVLDYNKECITKTSGITKLAPTNGNKKYILLNENGRWKLEEKNPIGKYDDYKDEFLVKQNQNWLYFQGTGTEKEDQNFQGKKFTRYITIEEQNDVTYLEETDPNNPHQPPKENNYWKWIKVTSTVQWRDMSSSWVRKIELSNFMTNHKK